MKEHPVVVRWEVSTGSGVAKQQSNSENGLPVDHVAGRLHRTADSLLWGSKEHKIIGCRERENDRAEARGEGSSREVNGHERAGSDEKPGAQTRERGSEEGALSATLAHS